MICEPNEMFQCKGVQDSQGYHKSHHGKISRLVLMMRCSSRGRERGGELNLSPSIAFSFCDRYLSRL